jgi:putative ABC transport system permease protein
MMTPLTFALRTLFKTPFVTAVAIVSLGLGIGANAAIFSMFNQLLLRPLPVQDPRALVNVRSPGPKPGSNSCGSAGPCDAVFSYAMFRDLFNANVAVRGQTSSEEGLLVSGSYFPVLGVTPVLGRLLTSADDRSPGQSPVAVLSHAFWQSRFGRDPNVLNEPIVVNGESLTIVGIAPRGFAGTTLGSTPDIFVPVTLRGRMLPNFFDGGFEDRRNYWLYLFARLKAGVTSQQAAVALNVPYRSILNEVEAPLQKGLSPQMLERFKAKQMFLDDGARGQSELSGQARAPLRLLLGVTAFVLLIACANIANLLLARSAARAGEMAVRLSIGAGRAQLIRQLLGESLLLAVFGGIGGLLVAQWTLTLLTSVMPREAAGSVRATLDPSVLIFAASLTLGTGMLFGLFPALHSTRPDLVASLKNQAGQPAGARAAARFRTSLATAQIALSMALLVAAGLFTSSLAQVSRTVEGFKTDPDTDTNANYNQIGAGYFRMLGMTLIAGREFTPADALGSGKVAIVNEAFAKKFNLGRDAVGRHLGTDGRQSEMSTTIVGLVQNAKYSEVKQEMPPVFFTPYRQDERVGSMTFYVRTAVPPASMFASIRKSVATLDSNLPVERLRTLPEQIRENVFIDRFITTLSAAFAVLATLLAAVGLYGVLAYTVSQRTREIGLRMALGASPARVRGMVLKQVGVMIVIGGAIGLAAAVSLGRLAESMLYQLKGWDPTVLAVSTSLLTIVALIAGFIPAHRASRVEPTRALRYE